MRRVFILDIKSILVMESELLGLMEKYVYFQLYNVYIFIFFNRFKSSWVKNVNEVQLWSGILEIYLGLFYIAVSTKRFAIIRCELGGRWLGSNYNVFACGDTVMVNKSRSTLLRSSNRIWSFPYYGLRSLDRILYI